VHVAYANVATNTGVLGFVTNTLYSFAIGQLNRLATLCHADVIAGLTRHPCGVLHMKKHCFEFKMQQPLLVALLLSL
jgi:hypothetical protein